MATAKSIDFLCSDMWPNVKKTPLINICQRSNLLLSLTSTFQTDATRSCIESAIIELKKPHLDMPWFRYLKRNCGHGLHYTEIESFVIPSILSRKMIKKRHAIRKHA